MKRKIGIALLIILNLSFIYVIMAAILTLGLVVAPLGHERGLEIANQTTIDLLIKLSISTVLMFSINYFLFKKLAINKRPLITSLILTLIGALISIPFFLSLRKSFIDYQNGTTLLQHYFESKTIDNIQIITFSDTIEVTQLNNFIIDVESAKYKPGMWKYMKEYKLIINRNSGIIDTIFTNGQMFGPYQHKYFSTEENVIEKYLNQ